MEANETTRKYDFDRVIRIVMTIVVVGVLIFAQTRYMIYNMPFVYIAMYLMLREMYFIWKDKVKRRAHA